MKEFIYTAEEFELEDDIYKKYIKVNNLDVEKLPIGISNTIYEKCQGINECVNEKIQMMFNELENDFKETDVDLKEYEITKK